MDHDDFALKFSKVLYTYLWYSEDYEFATEASVTEAFATVLEIRGEVIEFSDVLELVTETSKAIFLLSILTRPEFDKAIRDYFRRRLDITRLRVFSFMASYCFHNHAASEDIFDVVLHTFTFVYKTVIFCSGCGCEEFLGFAAMCWTEIFEADLKKDFHSRGGWREFMKYIAEKRYSSKGGNLDQRAVATFLEEMNYVSPKINQESRPSDHDSEDAVDNLEECLVVEPQACSEAAESSSDTAANVPGFNEKGEASVEVDNPQTNTEAAESSSDTAVSNLPGFNKKGEATVEVYKPQTNTEAAESLSDTAVSNLPGFNEKGEASVEIDKLQINSVATESWFRALGESIPEFHERVKSLLIDLDDVSAKIVTLVKESESKTSAQSSLLPSEDKVHTERSPAIQEEPKESLV